MASRRDGVGATGDGDGPLRDAFTNRDINIKRSFIFFYAPPSPTATSLANFNETLPATPVKILVALLQLLSPHPQDPAHALTGSRSGFRARFTSRSRRLQRGGEFYDDFVKSLYLSLSNTRHLSN